MNIFFINNQISFAEYSRNEKSWNIKFCTTKISTNFDLHIFLQNVYFTFWFHKIEMKIKIPFLAKLYARYEINERMPNSFT